MGETASLASLFLSSFLAATLLPGGSEAVLFLVLKAHPESLWPALALATIGNTLGGMVSFGMGWLLPRLGHGDAEHAGAGGAAAQPPTQQLKHVDKVRRYGTPALLFAWAPLVGDALCVAAGWLRLNPLSAAFFMLIGKAARYAVIVLAS